MKNDLGRQANDGGGVYLWDYIQGGRADEKPEPDTSFCEDTQIKKKNKKQFGRQLGVY